MHEMKLQDKYYDYILKGTKRIEIRLNDEKRKLIKIGDTIRFHKLPGDECMDVIVTNLYQYDSFDELFKHFDISLLADKSMTKDELKNILKEFYTKEEQDKYGVLGIEVKLKH